MRPLLSIVIVNSDGAADTLRCLESIVQNPPDMQQLAQRVECDPSYEVVVVDNESNDNCLEQIHECFPWVQTISAPQRQGFSKNYNLGIQQSRGMFVLVLNNDTLVHHGALTRLLAHMLDTPTCGMAGARLVSPDGTTQLDCARPLPTPRAYVLAQLLVDPGLPVGWLWQHYQRWRHTYMANGPVPCISGACMLVRRMALEQAGALDEAFVFYYEDIEWCHRFTRCGWSIDYLSDATLTHLGDRSLSKVKIKAKQSEYLSAMRYFQLYYGIGKLTLRFLWLVTALNWLLRGVIFLLLESVVGRSQHARAYLLLWPWLLNQRDRSNKESYT